MNILQINKFFHICDGTSRYYFNLSSLLKQKGHKVIHFSMEHPKNIKSKYSKYFVSNISFRQGERSNPIKILTRMFYSVEARRKLAKLLDQYRVDIAHIHSIYHHISPSVLFELKKRNIPVVMTVHDYHLISPNILMFHDNKVCEITKKDRFYKALFHRCVYGSVGASSLEVLEKYLHRIMKVNNLVDKYICPSEFVRRKFIEYGFPAVQLEVIPHFVDSSQYKYSDKKGDYILYFGGLYEHKGVEVLINTIKLLPEIKCLIVGKGPFQESIEKMIKRENISNIKLLGFVSDGRLKKYIQGSRFVVVPSVWYEGFGMVIIEANACGKPVLASNISAIPEVIINGKNGILFKTNDIEDILKKIIYLWKDNKKLVTMSNFSRKRVEGVYSKDLHYKKILRVYANLVK